MRHFPSKGDGTCGGHFVAENKFHVDRKGCYTRKAASVSDR
jgi:hypothetical protein